MPHPEGSTGGTAQRAQWREGIAVAHRVLWCSQFRAPSAWMPPSWSWSGLRDEQASRRTHDTSSDNPNSRSAVLVSSLFDFVWSGDTGTSKVTVSFRPDAEANRLTTLV